MDAHVLASAKIAKNAQLVAGIKYINFGMEEALEEPLRSINILNNLRRLSDKESQTRYAIYSKSNLKIFPTQYSFPSNFNPNSLICNFN